MLEDMTYATFAGHLGEAFRVHLAPSDVVELELVAATDLGAGAALSAGEAAPGGPGERFSIVFRGPRDRLLAQGTYGFEHDQLGSFPLFIVPIGAPADGIHYEAVFTRLPTPPAPTP